VCLAHNNDATFSLLWVIGERLNELLACVGNCHDRV
jgi:hypothetical protein